MQSFYPSEGDGEIFNLVTTITNQNMQDKTEVSENCLKDHEISPFGALLIDSYSRDATRCQYLPFVLSLPEFCKCVPFHYKASIPKNDLPFCSYEIYNSDCYNRLKDHISATAPCLDACITSVNSYSHSSNWDDGFYPTLEESDWNKDVHFMAQLRYVASGFSYSVYQEKFKLTAAQLVAQVGGDIGLYTGFSFIALWQFLFFLYHHQQKHREEKKQKVQQRSHDRDETWFSAILCYLESRGCKYTEAEATRRDDQKKEMNEMKERLNDCVKLDSLNDFVKLDETKSVRQNQQVQQDRLIEQEDELKSFKDQLRLLTDQMNKMTTDQQKTTKRKLQISRKASI
jgi:hypothetical protein